ncbi:MAG: hypothetical protein U5S82_17475 [Gammaproteobacteria bacterium]|nr:hypothetical protein [Gammaproteobacteria bacterium]
MVIVGALFVEHGDVALRGGHEQFGGHTDEDAVVACGVIGERVTLMPRAA